MEDQDVKTVINAPTPMSTSPVKKRGAGVQLFTTKLLTTERSIGKIQKKKIFRNRAATIGRMTAALELITGAKYLVVLVERKSGQVVHFCSSELVATVTSDLSAPIAALSEAMGNNKQLAETIAAVSSTVSID